MKTYLITGCAGFIGSNFVHYMLKKYPEILLVNLDKLTYAGNLENLKDVEGDPRHVFVQGDICDKELVESLFAKYDFDYVINFAAESHVDRSIKNPEIFVQSNVMGTVNLLQRAKEAWYDADAKTWKEGKKYLQVSTDEVYGALGADGFFMETTPLCPHSPYFGDNRHGELAHRQRGENAQRRLRAHACHLTELFEHRALLPGGEAEQLHGVLAHVQHGIAAPFFALRGGFRQRRVGAEQQKTDAARADDQLARRLAFDCAFDEINHGSLT